MDFIINYQYYFYVNHIYDYFVIYSQSRQNVTLKKSRTDGVIIYLYYKERRQSETFVTQFGPTLPLAPDPPVRLRDDKKVERSLKSQFEECFCQKVNSFITHIRSTRPPYPRGPTEVCISAKKTSPHPLDAARLLRGLRAPASSSSRPVAAARGRGGTASTRLASSRPPHGTRWCRSARWRRSAHPVAAARGRGLRLARREELFHRIARYTELTENFGRNYRGTEEWKLHGCGYLSSTKSLLASPSSVVLVKAGRTSSCMLPPTTAEAGATRWLPRGHLLLGLLLASSASCLLRFLGGLLHRTIEQKRDLKLTDREIERGQSDRESTGDWER
jgi:hypothetical protein